MTKLCKDCQHVFVVHGPKEPWFCCTSWLSRSTDCLEERESDDDDACGPEGRYWEPKQ